ncbi:MAG: DUF4350 domain-containing protein [Spirulinaceae cyanobacterium]
MKVMSRRWLVWVAIALGVMVVLTLFSAPQQGDRLGSSYLRSPWGYSAWYEYAQAQGITLERWQQPLTELTAPTPQTLIRVRRELQRLPLDATEREWISQGNTLISLGHYQPATNAPFSSNLTSAVGSVRIETTRRATEAKNPLLSDRAGAVVWFEKMGNGQVIYATTPYLAANAYQSHPGNFDYLIFLATQSPTADSQLIQNPSPSIWIDEYIHSDRPDTENSPEAEENLWQYWLTTPIFPLVLQGVVILMVILWAYNRRFGQIQPLTTPAVNNSQAYIEALAGVLHKADCSNFTLETLGKEEQRQLQQALGLGTTPLKPEELIQAWVEQTQKSPKTLEKLLHTQTRKRPLSDVKLGQWYLAWQKLLKPKP